MCSSISPRRLYYAQEGKCFHCGGDMNKFPEESGSVNKNGWTREHFIPRAHLKGKKIKYNIVLAHGRCNRSRDTRYPTSEEVHKYRLIYFKILGVKV